MLSTLAAALYALLLLSYIAIAWAFVRRPHAPRVMRWRQWLMGHRPRFVHLLGIWAVNLVVFVVAAHMRWLGVAMLVIFEPLLWLFLYLYVLPKIRHEHRMDELLKMDIDINATTRNAFGVVRRG